MCSSQDVSPHIPLTLFPRRPWHLLHESPEGPTRDWLSRPWTQVLQHVRCDLISLHSHSNSFERELFSKRYGHHEWVSSVAHLPNGRMISGGMDNLLCYWDAKGVRCDTLMGHQGSVTKVMTDHTGTAISASYDGTMIIWNLSGLDEARKLFGPHKQAVMDFDWKNSLVVSGDRQGVVAFWDINEGEAVSQKRVHTGAVSQTVLYGDGGNNNLILTAGINDGVLAVHDMR